MFSSDGLPARTSSREVAIARLVGAYVIDSHRGARNGVPDAFPRDGDSGVAFLWLRPRDIRPLLPLVIPMLIVIKIVAPGSIATLKESVPSLARGKGLIA